MSTMTRYQPVGTTGGGSGGGVATINGKSPDGSGVVTLTPSDIGAQAADARLGIVAGITVAPEAYGAIGNGSTDDTSAVQSAINASGGGKPALLTKTYRLTSPVTVPSGAWVHLAHGSALVRDHASSGNGGGTLINVDQTGGNTDIAVTGTGRIYSASSAKTGKHLSFVKVDKLRIHDVAFDGVFSDWNITLKDCSRAQVRGVRCDSGSTNGTDGLHIYGGNKITVSDCVIKAGDDAISLTVENATNGWVEDVVITNCVLASTNASGVKIHANAPATTGVRRVRMSGLAITHSSAGVGVWLRDQIGSAVYDISIDGMTIDAGSASNTAFQADGLTRLTVTDLTVINPSGRPIYLNGGAKLALHSPRVFGQRGAGQHDIRVDGATDVRIAGGNLNGATANGIMLGSSSAVVDVLVDGVTIDGASGTGMRVVNGTGVRMTRCRIKNCGSAYIEDLGGSVTTCTVIEGNDFRSNSAQPSSLTASDITARNNLGITVAAATPALIVAGAALLNPAAAVWPAANRALFSRFSLATDTPLRYVLWRCDTSSGNVMLGIVRLSGADHGTFVRLANTGIIACPTAGDIRTDLGAVTYPAGDYAVFLWADNTTMQTRVATASVLPSQRIAGIASSLTTGVISSGPLSWGNQYTVLSVEGDTAAAGGGGPTGAYPAAYSSAY